MQDPTSKRQEGTRPSPATLQRGARRAEKKQRAAGGHCKQPDAATTRCARIARQRPSKSLRVQRAALGAPIDSLWV